MRARVSLIISWMAVTTVTTRDSCRPKTHAKPTQVHASGRERVQPPQQNPSERASNASTLATCLILLSPFSSYLLYLDSSLSSRLIGIHMYPSALRPSRLTFTIRLLIPGSTRPRSRLSKYLSAVSPLYCTRLARLPGHRLTFRPLVYKL